MEWLEYHILVGVEHFFLYDTSPASPPPLSTSSHSSAKKRTVGKAISAGDTNIYPNRAYGLQSMLSEYVRLGIVTIIPWHHTQCDRAVYVRANMSSPSSFSSGSDSGSGSGSNNEKIKQIIIITVNSKQKTENSKKNEKQ